jgi:hypothetical protein
VKNILILVIVAGFAWFGYGKYKAATAISSAGQVPASVASASAPLAGAGESVASLFKCDGRTMCSQMTSCAEATYFVQHCPNTKMDGDNDGVPCERQWCN